MSDRPFEGLDKMSVAVINQAKTMGDFILSKAFRGPGDTIDAAMHRAERQYGVPAHWLHRLRYRELKDMPASAFLALAQGYQAALSQADRAYEKERSRHDVNSTLVGLADLVAGKEAETK
jgi:hypothetical protein